MEEETMSQTETRAVLVPEEVRAFAREQGVEAFLPVVLEMARRVFPEAVVEIGLDHDPEIEGMCHLLVVAAGVRRSVEEALRARDEYHQSLLTCIPAPLIWIFRLRLRFAT